MKPIVILSIGCLMLGFSCAKVEEQSQSQTKTRPLKQEEPLKVESTLISAEYTLSTVMEAAKPISDHIYILARHGKDEIQIRNTEDFAQIVREITSSEEALEFVRLLDSQAIRPFLQDIYYSEVHRKTDAEDRWFAIEPKQYEAWNLHEPVVSEDNGIYTIERFVACYPRLIHNKVITDAKLIKIREWVAPDGKYDAEIRDTVVEGEEIRKILIFTK